MSKTHRQINKPHQLGTKQKEGLNQKQGGCDGFVTCIFKEIKKKKTYNQKVKIYFFAFINIEKFEIC